MGVRVIIVDEEKRDRFTCPFCSKVFDKPHQADCGDRYCEACFIKFTAAFTTDSVKCLCCNEALKSSESYKDSACQRELNGLLVECGWTGCDWEGKFADFKGHESSCKYVLVKCDQCEEMVTRQALDMHKMTHQRVGAVDERDGAQRMINQNYDVNVTSSSPDQTAVARLAQCEEEARKLRQMLEQLQTNYADLMLIVQSLQATSYNGRYIWKIPEVDRRWGEAKEGRTLSLYSAPFYTSRHGYRMCLRLYLNGDGTGKGTHLSYFLTIMRGEFDALLQWPFQQVVRLVLRSQSSSKPDLRHCFKPDAYSSSFMRPNSDMNIASGCPRFAPLSVLSDEAYVQDDTMFLQCHIDLTGLENVD